MVAKLGTDIARCHTLQVQMRVLISQLDDEGLDTILLPIDKHLGEDNGMVGQESTVPGPKFSASNSRRVNNKFVPTLVKRGSSLNSLINIKLNRPYSDIGSMA